LGINGTENTLKAPPLLIRQNPTGIRDFLTYRFAKVLIFAPLAEIRFLLEILICRSFWQKFVLLQGLLSRPKVRNIGYARVSTLDQNLDLQLQALRKAGCQKVFGEKISGVGREAARRLVIHFGRLRSSTTSRHNWHNGSSTRENLSEKSLTASTSTPQPSIGSQRRWFKCIFCSVWWCMSIGGKSSGRHIREFCS